jgi:hypothetical protein
MALERVRERAAARVGRGVMRGAIWGWRWTKRSPESPAVSNGAAALAGAHRQGGTGHGGEEGEVLEHRELTRSATKWSEGDEEAGRRCHGRQ